VEFGTGYDDGARCLCPRIFSSFVSLSPETVLASDVLSIIVSVLGFSQGNTIPRPLIPHHMKMQNYTIFKTEIATMYHCFECD